MNSAAAGLCALIPSYIFVSLLSYYSPQTAKEWKSIFTFAYSGTAFTSLLFLLLATIFERKYNDEESQIINIVHEDNDAVELIFLKAFQEEKPISITLKNNKVYIGFIQQTFFTPYQSLKSIKVIPIISGYRNKANKRIKFTTVYEHIIEFVDSNETMNLDINDFQIGLPLSEITSVNIFDFRVYELFQYSDPDQKNLNF